MLNVWSLLYSQFTILSILHLLYLLTFALSVIVLLFLLLVCNMSLSLVHTNMFFLNISFFFVGKGMFGNINNTNNAALKEYL